jgi:hypothetical protein
MLLGYQGPSSNGFPPAGPTNPEKPDMPTNGTTLRGNLLSLKQQPRRLEQIEFEHTFGTVEKQGVTAEATPIGAFTPQR